MKIHKSLLFLLLLSGVFKVFAVESTAYVIEIIPYPGRQNALQVFLNENADPLWEKRLDLFGEGVQQILKDNIKEGGAVIYETEGLQSKNFTSNRLLGIILPDGNKIKVLDLFPNFNNTTLNFSFPYAFARRE